MNICCKVFKVSLFSWSSIFSLFSKAPNFNCKNKFFSVSVGEILSTYKSTKLLTRCLTRFWLIWRRKITESRATHASVRLAHLVWWYQKVRLYGWRTIACEGASLSFLLITSIYLRQLITLRMCQSKIQSFHELCIEFQKMHAWHKTISRK